jgi:transposase
MVRIDAIWITSAPMDMRAGTDTALVRAVQAFCAAHPHHAYLFTNQRANRMKVLVHDGIRIWLAARRLHQGHFIWLNSEHATQLEISRIQLDALVLELPWNRLGEAGIIRVL